MAIPCLQIDCKQVKFFSYQRNMSTPMTDLFGLVFGRGGALPGAVQAGHHRPYGMLLGYLQHYPVASPGTKESNPQSVPRKTCTHFNFFPCLGFTRTPPPRTPFMLVGFVTLSNSLSRQLAATMEKLCTSSPTRLVFGRSFSAETATAKQAHDSSITSPVRCLSIHSSPSKELGDAALLEALGLRISSITHAES